MIICGGSGDVHLFIWKFFTSISWVVSLAPMPLYPWECTHDSH